MQSKIEEFVEPEAMEIQKNHPRSFGLYTEYSRRNITEIIRTRRDSFERCNLDARKALVTEVEKEVESFCTWLEETKNMDSNAAHYYSMSIKSLLLGLPVGVQIACLFDGIFDKQI